MSTGDRGLIKDGEPAHEPFPSSALDTQPSSALSTRHSTLVPAGSDPAEPDLLGDPGEDLVEGGVERGGGLEAEHVAGLPDVGHAPLDVVVERGVADVAERGVALDLPPDPFGQLEHRR